MDDKKDPVFPPREVEVFRTQPQDPRFSIKLTRNASGFTWEASVLSAKTVKDAIGFIEELEREMEPRYGRGAPRR